MKLLIFIALSISTVFAYGDDDQYRGKCRDTVIASAAAEVGSMFRVEDGGQIRVNRVVETALSPEFNIVVEFDKPVTENSTTTSVLVLMDLETCNIAYFLNLLSN